MTVLDAVRIAAFVLVAFSVSFSDSRRPARARRAQRLTFQKEPFTLQEVVFDEYRQEDWNGTWETDTEYSFRTTDGGLALHDVVSGQTRELLPASELEEPAVAATKLSPDKQYVLLAFNPEKTFRYSFLAQYDVFDLKTGRRTHLQPSEATLKASNLEAEINSLDQLPLSYVTWSPKGHGLAYVFDNNVYFRESPESPDIIVSTSGIPGVVFNGVADWVYEEEVLGDTRALWISPDSKHIVWIEFNDTEVEVMPLELYGQSGTLEFQYPLPTPLRYPKPGRTNPFVNVYAASLVSNVDSVSRRASPLLLPPPLFFDNNEKIIFAVTWATDTEVSLTWENRHQNYSIVSLCDVNRIECMDSLVVEQHKGWMELQDAPLFKKDGRQFAMALSTDNFTHVNVINRDTNQRVTLTNGEIVVTSILHWDEVNHVIYFKATREGAPGERHLYTVTDLNHAQPGAITCLSCGVTNSRRGACGYNDFTFSKEHSYYTMSCQGPHVPQDYLFQTPNKKLGTLTTNAELTKSLELKLLPKVSHLDVPIGDGNYTAKVRLYLPHDFDERKKYPMLVDVYAGPNSQQVDSRFKLDWGTYLSTSEGIIYALIDGRGSGFRGDNLLYEVYYRLGSVEVQDQIDVTKHLVSKYSFIDGSNVAIWGWSYGGFVTLSALAADADQSNVFKCGIAVAPVTNWIYYDSIYTERFMGLPSPGDNFEGYANGDISAKAEKLRNKKLLLIHGTADDNVHYQQTMMLTKALEEADVLFQQLSYPDENHAIGGLRKHLYHALTNFIVNDCFGKNKVISG